MEITDEMCRRYLKASKPDRIQGFSTRHKDGSVWGAPHYILDTFRPAGEQEIWRGDDHDEMIERCLIEEIRVALAAALSEAPTP